MAPPSAYIKPKPLFCPLYEMVELSMCLVRTDMSWFVSPCTYGSAAAVNGYKCVYIHVYIPYCIQMVECGPATLIPGSSLLIGKETW